MSRRPFRFDKDGEPVPLFVPPAALEAFRSRYPNIWVEPTPMIPVEPGHVYTAADMRRA